MNWVSRCRGSALRHRHTCHGVAPVGSRFAPARSAGAKAVGDRPRRADQSDPCLKSLARLWAALALRAHFKSHIQNATTLVSIGYEPQSPHRRGLPLVWCNRAPGAVGGQRWSETACSKERCLETGYHLAEDERHRGSDQCTAPRPWQINSSRRCDGEARGDRQYDYIGVGACGLQRSPLFVLHNALI